MKFQLPDICDDLATTAATLIGGNAYKNVKDAISPPCAVAQWSAPVADYSEITTIKKANIRATYKIGLIIISGGRNYDTASGVLGGWLDPEGDLYQGVSGIDTGNAWISEASQLNRYRVGDGEYLGFEWTVEVWPNEKP